MPTPQHKKRNRSKPNAFTRALALALEPAGEAVTVAGLDGFIIEANPAVAEVYRRPVDKIIGRHPLIFCPNTEEWKKLSKTIWDAIQAGGKWDGVVINMEPDSKEVFPILLRTRKIGFGGADYAISWARPFPAFTPFALTDKEAAVFALAGEGKATKQIAGLLGIGVSSVTARFRSIWKKVAEKRRVFSTQKFTNFAVLCHAAGWKPEMRLNEHLQAPDSIRAAHPGHAGQAAR